MYRVGNERTGSSLLVMKVAGGTEIKEATLVALNESGYLVPAAKDATLRVAGVAQQYVDNRNGANGDQEVEVKRGAFVFDNDGSILETDLLKKCYVSNATTLTKTADASIIVGTILEVQDDGITVEIQ